MTPLSFWSVVSDFLILLNFVPKFSFKYKALCFFLTKSINIKSYVLLFQVVALIVQTFAWCSMLVMLVVETKVYVYEFRWIIRFGVVYILVADIVMLNLILSLKDFYKRYFLMFVKGVRLILFLKSSMTSG